MPKAHTSLLDRVRGTVLSWWEGLDKSAQDELLEVRRQYRDGKLGTGKYKIANAILSHAKAEGWNIPGEKALVRWLQKSDD